MATIKDVAKRAGVSPSTASRAMHDSPLISKQTKDKVRQAMKELDYSPNFAAQNLANQTSNTIGVILPAREDAVGDNPFYIQLIQGLSTVCNEHDHLVAVASGQTEQELIKNIETMIKRGNITRFVFLYSKADDQVLAYIRQQRAIHYVVIGSPYTEKAATCYVDNDNFQAGYDATEFLLNKGVTQLVYVYTNLDEKVQNARFKGYQAALAKNKHLGAAWELQEDENVAGARLQELVNQAPGRLGVIACDDIVAIELQHLSDLNAIAPEKLALLGFNNSLLAKTARPALTSVEIFPRLLGAKAASLVIPTADQGDSRQVIVPHQIIERASTQF